MTNSSIARRFPGQQYQGRMMTRPSRAIAAAASLVSSLLGSTAHAAPASAPPPYEGAYQPKGVDEIGLWQRDDEYARALVASTRSEENTSELQTLMSSSYA